MQDIQLKFESIEKQNAPSQCLRPTLIKDVMACALHNKWFDMSDPFFGTSSHKNVQLRSSIGYYVTLANGVVLGFSTERQV